MSSDSFMKHHFNKISICEYNGTNFIGGVCYNYSNGKGKKINDSLSFANKEG